MKKLVVLGPGCPRCENLLRIAGQAAEELGIEYHLEKLTDITKFSEYGLMMTPGLVIDGELRVQGKVPTIDDIKSMLA